MQCVCPQEYFLRLHFCRRIRKIKKKKKRDDKIIHECEKVINSIITKIEMVHRIQRSHFGSTPADEWVHIPKVRLKLTDPFTGQQFRHEVSEDPGANGKPH